MNQKELNELELIEEQIGLSVSQLERKTWLLCENLKSLEQEEIYWYERSHANWLLKGNNNTSFFTNVQMIGKGKIILWFWKKMGW